MEFGYCSHPDYRFVLTLNTPMDVDTLVAAASEAIEARKATYLEPQESDARIVEGGQRAASNNEWHDQIIRMKDLSVVLYLAEGLERFHQTTPVLIGKKVLDESELTRQEQGNHAKVLAFELGAYADIEAMTSPPQESFNSEP